MSTQDLIIKGKPILKWAGGKTQLLKYIIPKMPNNYGKYIEPFVGGGALFFAVAPHNAVIADSNPELINTYRQVADHVDQVISYLKQHINEKGYFLKIRALKWDQLEPAEAAARMIYLNRTCFNGLYRVNKKGDFNVPFGNYKNPTICDEEHLREASVVLKNAHIVCGDYLTVLQQWASPGDFIFLDPPYLPVSQYSDFKRYTKEQFYEEDHIELAKEVERLYDLGCYIILTNSNTSLVHDLYHKFNIEVIQTHRSISSKGSTRKGEDVIITAFPEKKIILPLPKQVKKYPPTRFMGSKRKLLEELYNVSCKFNFHSVLDLFSGSGVVSYMYKAMGKKIISNDYMYMSTTYSKALIENNIVRLPIEEAKQLLVKPTILDTFVEDTFQGLYYTDEENQIIDILRTNISGIDDPYKKAIAKMALIRACIKKRPRGIFTYTGFRYNDGRKDLQKSMEEQFLEAVQVINAGVFNNQQDNISRCGDAMTAKNEDVDLVYMDPPYYSPLSDNEYVRRYHFVEGIARDWKGVILQENTVTKKFKSYPTPFSSREGAADAFKRLFKTYRNSIIMVSYSSNSIPSKEDMIELLSTYKEHVDVYPIDYTYSFGNQNAAKTHRTKVQEYIFVGY